MRKAAVLVLVCSRLAVPAEAQDRRVYAAAVAAMDTGKRGPVDLGSFPAAGGGVGVRVWKGLGVELVIDRGFATSDDRVFEGILQVDTNVPITNQEERERKGVFGRTVDRSWAATGYSAHLVWASRTPSRVNAAFYAGLSWRDFKRQHVRTITAIGPEVTYPPNHLALRNIDETRTTTGGGLTAGAMIPIRLTGRLSAAPDVRVTFGVITDESTYVVLHTGVRLLWAF